jgi:hypothetical protein
MSFWITFCAIITHKSEKLHSCFNNFIFLILEYCTTNCWSAESYKGTHYSVWLSELFGFCGVTEHVNLSLNMWAELRCLYVFMVVSFLIHQLTRYLNSATLLTQPFLLSSQTVHFLFCSPITHRVSAVLTWLSHLHLVLSKCLPFFSFPLHLYKLELSTKLRLCTYSTTCSISSLCLHVISIYAVLIPCTDLKVVT